MIQICEEWVFDLVLKTVHRGKIAAFGIIQACLDVGGNDEIQARQVLSRLGVTEEELILWTKAFREDQANKLRERRW